MGGVLYLMLPGVVVTMVVIVMMVVADALGIVVDAFSGIRQKRDD